jgi:hypothetical protein
VVAATTMASQTDALGVLFAATGVYRSQERNGEIRSTPLGKNRQLNSLEKIKRI